MGHLATVATRTTQLPNLRSNYRVALRWTSVSCVEPTYKFIVHDALYIAGRLTISEPGQDRARLWIVFVAVLVVEGKMMKSNNNNDQNDEE